MKTVLVTGASSGIGKETAKTLLADGYAVYVAARRVDRMSELEQPGATALAMDITNDEDIVAAVKRITAERGGIDVLINNAGFGMYGAMEDTTLDDARYQFEVNLFGLARLTQLALPYMRDRGAGKIVNISSVGGKIYTPLGAWYHATKHALEGWSDSLRLELKPLGIDVIVIEPGIIRTEFGDVMVGPMLERSGQGPYADLASKLANATRASYESRVGRRRR
ncbi:oxidoreductase [Pseudonocardia sp. Cha107L01]|uniref:oxidoreductase n=1 Tax=Pseudonocardia sp. Cha107L01 TaxID=3457576 RepID=UPI00403E4DA0